MAGAWSGGFDETAAVPSDGLTAEHERHENPSGHESAEGLSAVLQKGREVFVSAEGGFRAYSCSPRRGSKDFSVVQCPPKAVSVYSVAKTHGVREVEGD